MLKGPEGRPFLGCGCALWGADRQGSTPAYFVSGFHSYTSGERDDEASRMPGWRPSARPASFQRPSPCMRLRHHWDNLEVAGAADAVVADRQGQWDRLGAQGKSLGK